jgi:hypothetical protein
LHIERPQIHGCRFAEACLRSALAASYNYSMSQEFHAIYEGGVFRPLTPLNLPELTPVTVVVQEQAEQE